jgi:hypothetical protein
MAARSMGSVCGLFFVAMALSGCSGTGCGWWGRNSDCSSSWGNKSAATTQPGPLAGTYTRPGNGMTTTPMLQQQANPNGGAAPVVTTSPATSYQGTVTPQTAVPGLPTPPSPLNSNLTPSNYQSPGGTSAPPLQGLPAAEINPAPEVRVSSPTIPMPMVQAPSMGYAMPGAPGSAPARVTAMDSMNKATPMPMILVPSAQQPNQVPPVAPNSVPTPQIGATPEVKMPVMNNAGQVPPIPPPPAIPMLDKN